MFNRKERPCHYLVLIVLKYHEISTAITNRNFVCLSKLKKKTIISINRLQQLRDADAFNFLFPRPSTRGYNNANYKRKVQDGRHMKCLGHECIYIQ